MTHAFYISIHIFKVKEFYYYINGLLVIKYSWDKLIGKEVSALSIMCVNNSILLTLIIIYIRVFYNYNILDNTALLTQFHTALLA